MGRGGCGSFVDGIVKSVQKGFVSDSCLQIGRRLFVHLPRVESCVRRECVPEVWQREEGDEECREVVVLTS